MAADRMRDVLLRATRDQAKRHTSLSLKLSVPGLGEIDCEDLLRVVPSKRITCVGHSGEKQLIVKLFFAKNGAGRHWRRSDRGCGYLMKKDIPAPAVLYSGYLSQQKIYAMIFEYLKDGANLKDCLEQAGPSARDSLLDALMGVVARQHEAGIIQQDLHLGNFMLSRGIIYSLDGDHVSSLDCPADRSGSFRNLAYLFAQNISFFGNGAEERIRYYAKQRGWHVPEQEMEEIRGHVRETRIRMFRKYRWKAARKGSSFLELSDAMKHRLKNGSMNGAGLDQSIFQRLGNDRAGGFRLVSTGQGRVPVADFSGYGPTALRWFWKVCRIWRNMSLLKMLGLNTADPVVITVRQRHFWRWDCSIVFRPVSGQTIREVFLSGALPETQRLAAAGALSDALCCLRDTGVYLRPINPDNIIYQDGGVIFLFVEQVREGAPEQLSLQLAEFLRHCRDLPGAGEIFEDQLGNKGLLKRTFS